MPKACPLLVSALNPQLGWGAQWKGVVADMACILVLHLLVLHCLYLYRIPASDGAFA